MTLLFSYEFFSVWALLVLVFEFLLVFDLLELLEKTFHSFWELRMLLSGVGSVEFVLITLHFLMEIYLYG